MLTPCAKTSAESSSQKAVSKESDAKIASYFCENGIAFNTAAFSSFALMVEDSQDKSYKVAHRVKFSGELLDNAYESTEKLVAPILAVATKCGATIACLLARDICLG